MKLTRRALLAATASLPATRAHAGDPLRVMTNYFASGEQGCFFQAQATGLYRDAGLDVTILPGNPQINAIQLLLGGEIDILMGKDIQVLSGLEKNIPTVAIAAMYQFENACVVARPDVTSLADLHGHRIMLSSSGRASYWPWLQRKYGYTEDQVVPYTGNLQPYFADPTMVVIGVSTGEPFRVKKQIPDARVYLLADAGYPPYGAPLVTTQAHLKNPDLLRRFLKATMEGWVSYFADPAPAFKLVREANPTIDPDNLTFAVDVMRATHQVDGGDARTMGMGIMTEARWQKTRDFMVESDMLKPETNWRAGFTTALISGVDVILPG
jgi:NitT/TauT family transport system substrate-binding protein